MPCSIEVLFDLGLFQTGVLAHQRLFVGRDGVLASEQTQQPSMVLASHHRDAPDIPQAQLA